MTMRINGSKFGDVFHVHEVEEEKHIDAGDSISLKSGRQETVLKTTFECGTVTYKHIFFYFGMLILCMVSN